MSSAETSELFNCSVPEFFKIVADYESYPKFLSEVKECKILEEREQQKLVEFHISLIKSFSYRLWLKEEAPYKVSWELESGDIFKLNRGHWHLEEEAEKTRAHYFVEAKFKVFVPGPVGKALVNVNLPNMMSSYHKRVQELYGK